MIVVLTAACGAKPPVPTGSNTMGTKTTESVTEEGLIVESVDLNLDGRPNILNYWRDIGNDRRRLVRKKTDLNLNGTFDIVSHFDESGALVLEEMDTDFDGRIDWIDHYKDGQRTMSEVDTSFDGRTDTFVYFEPDGSGTNVLTRKERDTNGDGQIDTWERFGPDGVVVRMGRDTTGDGKMDQRYD